MGIPIVIEPSLPLNSYCLMEGKIVAQSKAVIDALVSALNYASRCRKLTKYMLGNRKRQRLLREIRKLTWFDSSR